MQLGHGAAQAEIAPTPIERPTRRAGRLAVEVLLPASVTYRLLSLDEGCLRRP